MQESQCNFCGGSAKPVFYEGELICDNCGTDWEPLKGNTSEA